MQRLIFAPKKILTTKKTPDKAQNTKIAQAPTYSPANTKTSHPKTRKNDKAALQNDSNKKSNESSSTICATKRTTKGKKNTVATANARTKSKQTETTRTMRNNRPKGHQNTKATKSRPTRQEQRWQPNANGPKNLFTVSILKKKLNQPNFLK